MMMPPARGPGSRPAAQPRTATCLETDEDVMQALRSNLNLGAPPGPLPVAPVARPAAPQAREQAAPSGAATSVPFHPTVRPPMAVLTVFDDGRAEGEHIRLRDSRFVIGRTDGDLIIPHDAMISSRHVEITRQASGGQYRWVITDLQSTNGLFVRVQRTVLVDGSELLVGQGRYRLIDPVKSEPAANDYAPPQGGRNATQAWGGAEGAPAIPSLVELVGQRTGARTPLMAAEYWIGSDPSCAICRPTDLFCEPRHARLFRDAKGHWQIEHNKSLNGLWFRLPQVAADSTVLFQIGEQRFRLRVGV